MLMAAMIAMNQLSSDVSKNEKCDQ